MNIITSNPIVYGDDAQDYSLASGPAAPSAKKAKREAKRAEHKIERKQKQEVRQEQRAERRANRKAKYGARPLEGMIKGGVKKFKDKLPKLNKKVKDGGIEVFEKKMPDGTIKELAKSAIQEVPQGSGAPAYYDKADINTPKEVVQTKLPDGSVDLHKEYNASETEAVKAPDGTETTYKAEDVEDDKKGWAGLSKPVKIGIIVGGLAVLSFIGYKIYKSRKGKK